MTDDPTPATPVTHGTGTPSRPNTGLRVGVAVMLIGSVLVTLGALATTSASEYPNCPDGTTTIARYDVTDGVYGAVTGGDVVTVDNGTVSGGTWRSTELVSAVVIKGGPGSATTTIDPAQLAGIFDNSRLTPVGGVVPNIDSIQFCRTQDKPVALGYGPKPFTVTLAARTCPTYTDIIANRSRNNIQESLEDLGPDTNYAPDEVVNPAKEAASPQDNCSPLTGWNFQFGSGFTGKSPSTANLSTVTGGSTISATTASVPELDAAGNNTGRTLDGAVVYTLSDSQKSQALKGSLWIQGGTKAAPLGDGSLSFGALRCATDNYNGDNVEYIRYPTESRNVFCFAYYVTQPPEPATITVRKQLTEESPGATTFEFTGDTSFIPGGKFTLRPEHKGGSDEISFVRAANVNWTVSETVPDGWTLASLECTTPASGRKAIIDGPQFTANLDEGDAIVCTYTNDKTPKPNPTPSPTPDPTPTPTPDPTPSPTPGPTPSPTPSPTPTPTPTPSPTPAPTPTPSPTPTPTPSPTPGPTPSPTPGPTPSPTPGPTPSPTPTPAPSPSPTPNPSTSSTTTAPLVPTPGAGPTTTPDAPAGTPGPAPSSPSAVGGKVAIRTDVTADDSRTGALAFTGGSATSLLALGIILLIAGATASAVSWQRRRTT